MNNVSYHILNSAEKFPIKLLKLNSRSNLLRESQQSNYSMEQADCGGIFNHCLGGVNPHAQYDSGSEDANTRGPVKSTNFTHWGYAIHVQTSSFWLVSHLVTVKVSLLIMTVKVLGWKFLGSLKDFSILMKFKTSVGTSESCRSFKAGNIFLGFWRILKFFQIS